MPKLDRLPFAEYAKLAGVNWSALRNMRKSRLAYRWALENPQPVTDAMRVGTVAHIAVFEPDTLPLRVAVWDGGRRYGKEWDCFCAANEGRTIVTERDYAKCLAMRDAVRGHPIAGKYVQAGKPEVSITWRDDLSGLDCKARLDFISAPPTFAIVDLKTTAHLEKRRFCNLGFDFGYHCQLAFYCRGWFTVTGQAPAAVILAVESDPPHDVAVYRVEPDVLAKAENEIDRLLALLSECIREGRWPGMYECEQVYELPPWAQAEEDDLPVGPDGQPMRF